MGLAAIQKVELVGGESWWSHNLGSLVVGVAAIVAAGLAAYISVRNHKQQLAHDREIRDRDATRKAIEIAVQGMSGFILEGVTFAEKIRILEKNRALIAEDPDDDEAAAWQRRLHSAESEANKIVPSIYAATNTMHANTILLAIRLGKKHPITTAHAETREALKLWFVGLSRARTNNRDEAGLEASEKALKLISGARTKFETACFSWMTGSS